MKAAIIQHFNGDYRPLFEGYLGELTRAGKQYRARCPFHDDHRPSLDIEHTTGQWHCKVCQTGGDHFKLVAKIKGLDGNFPAVLADIAAKFGITGNGSPQKAPTKPASRLVKRFAYQTPDGYDLFCKNRYEPKGFSLCRPDGNGGYLSGMGGVKPVLYRLPDVIASDEVWIVEGEKDADALADLGITATTNFDGAGKWSETYNEHLTGKHVILIPDQDEPGRAHMQKVAAALHGVAASVKILELPNPTGKKGFDSFDFIAEQVDPETAAERLFIIAEGAAVFQPEPAAVEKPRFEFIHNADVMTNLKPIEWRIRDILPETSFYYDFGESGHYKTFVALDRLLCVAAGLPYHGHPVNQGTVFYIAGEGQQGIGRRIVAWHAMHRTRAADVPFFIAKTPTQLMDPSALDDVKKAVDVMAKAYGEPSIIHFDTLARNFGAGDENATADMNQVILNLDMAFGSIIRGLSHHTGHMNKDRARGNYALHAAADAAFRIRITGDNLVLVECRKMKDAPETDPMVFSRETVLLQIQETEDQSCVLKLLAEGEKALEIAKDQGGNNEKVSDNMKKALETLDCLYAEYEANLAASGRSGTSPRVSIKNWRERCIETGIYGQAKYFNVAMDRMKQRNLVKLDANGVFAVSSSILLKYYENDEF
jgi:5S rRNA maturation endonuclease (ribonuclease M5)